VFNCGLLFKDKTLAELIEDDVIIWSIFDPRIKKCRRLNQDTDEFEMCKIMGMITHIMQQFSVPIDSSAYDGATFLVEMKRGQTIEHSHDISHAAGILTSMILN
jgi:hypothetical protein